MLLRRSTHTDAAENITSFTNIGGKNVSDAACVLKKSHLVHQFQNEVFKNT